MADFTILMYEDESDWKDSFEYGIKGKIKLKGKTLVLKHRLNSDTLEQDLLMIDPDLIMVDHDLGEETGDEIIEIIEGNPEFNNVSIYYYSGGESLDDLRETAKKFKCQIQCFTKEGDELDAAVLGLV
jgi:hypothetical protein